VECDIMFKWYKHTDISIISKLDAKEKGDTQNLTQNVFLKNLKIEGKVGSYLSWNKIITFT
jgi:hypothetical protein